MSRIGIYSGTFDPVHNGHLAFAEAALEHGLDKILFLVEPRPRRKQGVRALEHRQAMVELAIRDNPKMSSILLEQARFTVNETLPVLQARFPGYRLVLMFGDDVISHISHWPHVTDLVESVDLLIATRQHHEAALHQVIKTLAVTRNLQINYELAILDHKMTSSSNMRQAIKKGLPVDLPGQVLEYVHKQGLYEPRILE